ncbi:phage DNA ejection protein [Enterobacter hormaechei]|uniref:phage DNA ejection protein n=1 Tax=Enterobacter hormaechei TaxID=158836 RepID=UPI0034D2C80D
MAIGSRYTGGGNNYLGMAQQGEKEGLSEAKNLGGMLSQGFQLGSQMGDRARLQQARKVFGDAWSTGDPKEIERAMQLFPEFAKKAQEMIGIRDDQHRKDTGSLMMRLNALASVGDGEGISALVDQSGGLLDTQTSGQLKKMAGLLSDPKKAEAAKSFLDRYTSGMAVSTVSPLEAIKHATEIQRMAQQYDLGEQRIGLQRELGQQRNSLGWARLNQMSDYREQMLNRGTPGEREWAFFNNLNPEDQAKYLSMKRGPAGGNGGASGMFSGPQTVKLANGQSVEIDPKVHGQGAGAFYQGRDAEGKLINVPVSTVVTPVSSPGLAGQKALSKDLASLLNADQSDLEHITGYARGGSVGRLPFGADTYTGFKGGTARDIYSAANRVQGNMQNKGIAAAKEMGASGINTVAEAKMYFQSMPQLDFSSPESLISSAKGIKEYTEQFNQQHGVNYSSEAGKGGKNGVADLSDEDLLKGL